MAKLPMSARPEITPSRMFLAGRSVPPGKVCTLTLPPVLFSTSPAQCSIWTQGKVGAGGKLAYVRVIALASAAGTGAGRSVARSDSPARRGRTFLNRMGFLLGTSTRPDISTHSVFIGTVRRPGRRADIVAAWRQNLSRIAGANQYESRSAALYGEIRSPGIEGAGPGPAAASNAFPPTPTGGSPGRRRWRRPGVGSRIEDSGKSRR